MSVLQLLCLPHARGSAAFYQRWSESLPHWIEVRALNLSGLGIEPGSQSSMDIGMLVEQLAGECTETERQPRVLFGHGLGGLLAFELAHWLRLSGRDEPLALFVSGSVAPARVDCARRQALKYLGDTWLHGLEDGPGRDAFVLPGGLQLPAGYVYRQRAPLRSSIHVLGRRQGGISAEMLLEWQQETRSDFSLDLLERHHFFIQQQEARTLRLVCRYCEHHLLRWRSEGLRATG